MTLLHILIFAAAALPYHLLIPRRWRVYALLAMSVIAVYWLSPSLGIIPADSTLLATLTLALAIIVWWLTRSPSNGPPTTADGIALLIGVISAAGYVIVGHLLSANDSSAVLPWLLVIAAALTGGAASRDHRTVQRWLLLVAVGLLVILLLMIKTPTVAIRAADVFRQLSPASAEDAIPGIPLSWIGFSYLAFRLIHMLRDRLTGRLPDLSLAEGVTYSLFFPAFTAGPIDRAERFAADVRALPSVARLSARHMLSGGMRIALGLFKKFVVADSLALIALSGDLLPQFQSTGSLWIALYAFGFRIFFDFSGYSDIAIGLGYLFGITLPENFDSPYLATDIAAFWRNWHMTLTNWVRFYVFSPLSRFLMTRQKRLPSLVIVFVAQLTTMLIIGLWHGVSWTFLMWGAWHGLGLFIHKVWSDRSRTWQQTWNEKPAIRHLWSGISGFLTFQYVTLGWVWFVLPDVQVAFSTFGRLFGISG